MEEPTGINSQRRTNLLAGTESLRLLPRVGTAAPTTLCSLSL
jgi:hypothetical protein